MNPGARGLAIFAVGILVACGGGGGGGGGGGPPPVLGTVTFTTVEDTDLSGQITATGTGTLTFTKTSDPASGTLTSFGSGGAFVYRPNADFAGSDTFNISVANAGGGSVAGAVTITVTGVNDAPVANNDVLRADGVQLASIAVLANDRDAESDALTLTIEQAAAVGAATVNANNTVSIASLPPGFRGLTQFKYRVADPAGLSSVATAAIFVDTDPFRVAYAGETAAAGSPEVFMTDFVSPSWQVSKATDANLRLRGFVASDNGSTVVYRREDVTSASITDLSFVRTATSETQVRVTLPTGYKLAPDANGHDQFTVSPDGKWIAVIADSASPVRINLFLFNVDTPTAIRSVLPVTANYATLPRFSVNSQTLYFLAADAVSGAKKSLYSVAANDSAAPALLSAAYGPGSPPTDDVEQYTVSRDDLRIVLQANRGGRRGIYYVNPAQVGSELMLNQTLGLLDRIEESTVGLPPGRGSPLDGNRVAYTALVGLFAQPAVYVAEISATPNPRLVEGNGARVISLRPDGGAVLYYKPVSIPAVDHTFEKIIDAGAAEQPVAQGNFALYDATGDAVIARRAISGGLFVLASSIRGNFGSSADLGTAGQAARYRDLSGVERAVALIGEGATSGSPTTARIALVNAFAPDKLIYLADFQSPLGLTSEASYVVTY